MDLNVNDRGVSFVESVAHTYSRVKQLSAALVVVLTDSSYADPGLTAMRMN